MIQDWSTVFRRSTVHPAVFAVRDGTAAGCLVGWARERALPHRHQAYAFAAELEGWALLDGGLSYLQAHARGRLRSGLRVIGWSVLRLLAEELRLVPPRRLLVAEQARQPADLLQRLAHAGWLTQGPGVRQATLLVSYVDARGLAGVADHLVGRPLAPPLAAGTPAPAPRLVPLTVRRAQRGRSDAPHLVHEAGDLRAQQFGHRDEPIGLA